MNTLMNTEDLWEIQSAQQRFLHDAEQWSLLDDTSGPVMATLECILEAIASFDVVLDGKKSSQELLSLLNEIKVQTSLSCMLLVETLRDLIDTPLPSRHHEQLNLRLDYNEFYTAPRSNSD